MDYSKAVNSLLLKLQKANVAITHVHDGEQWERVAVGSNLKVRKSAVEIITSVDESMVHVKHDGVVGKLYLILGNEPNEILADYSAPAKVTADGRVVNSKLWEILEQVSVKFYEQWED